MKITERLVGDHKTFHKILEELNALADLPHGTESVPKLIRLVELFKDHLVIHSWAEDTFYYPAVLAAIPKAPPVLTQAYMKHLDDEHQTIDGYLDHLEREVKAKPFSPSWRQSYALFAKGLLAHMKKEEEELFPISEQTLGADALEEISRNLESYRSRAPKIRRHHLGANKEAEFL